MRVEKKHAAPRRIRCVFQELEANIETQGAQIASRSTLRCRSRPGHSSGPGPGDALSRGLGLRLGVFFRIPHFAKVRRPLQHESPSGLQEPCIRHRTELPLLVLVAVPARVVCLQLLGCSVFSQSSAVYYTLG